MSIDDQRTQEVQAEIQTYMKIFVALAILTMATVGVAYLDLPQSASILVALLIAAGKIFLIGAFFMHLLHEGKLINWSLAVCVSLLLVLLVFVLPDIGIHPIEEEIRAGVSEAQKIYGHAEHAAGAAAEAH